MSFPLQAAKICLEETCQFVFAGGNNVCIRCGSSAWIWLAKYIKDLKTANEKVGRIGDTNEYIKDGYDFNVHADRDV